MLCVTHQRLAGTLEDVAAVLTGARLGVVAADEPEVVGLLDTLRHRGDRCFHYRVNTTDLLSGLMRFTSNRPTCGTQHYKSGPDGLKRLTLAKDDVTVGCSESRSMTLNIQVNKSAANDSPPQYVEYCIEPAL
ncbi:hypothetical protein EYF80_023045 [Liparis tanakae]|uniref:Uncharacterized protein n=1 Tax=Liparis tanakae TaxID=230148 RepID=A0A4Z2HP92_9TELE|nr:hypothetical protein EYF80_023045 [Liparis tanakae]